MSTGSLLHAESTALVVIDLQEKLVPAIDGVEVVLANTLKLLELAKILKLPTFLTTQYSKGLGPTVPEILGATDTEPQDKVCFGCFGHEPFLDAVRERMPPGSSLLLAGVETHICVLQTALGGLEAGYDVHVAADAVGSRAALSHSLGLERMRSAGVVISSAEMAIYELLGDARRTEFKQMLPFLK
jgi:nicotinamidase-related amidase